MHDASSSHAPLNWRPTANRRRLWLAFFSLGQSALATWLLLTLLPLHGEGRNSWLELSLVLVFFLLHAWIAVGFWTAVLGFLLRRRGGDRFSLLHRYSEAQLQNTPLTSTAIVLPVCHEPVQRTLAGLRALYLDLQRSGHLQHFEFYVLSDSRDPEIWLEEQVRWQHLCDELGAEGRLFYRRRTLNLNYKSGNIADFLRRWGRRSTYMVVLDADSLMSADTVLRMVRLMQREPQVGILQSSPAVVRGRSLFARLQQFANRTYAGLYSTGLAAIQMGDAAFWGHNAIVRSEAFMAHCGLRKLRGPGLFRGPIISHDFVEAAYMGRAGYEVWLEPGLQGSYEESPPTLADELERDRRWVRGNLQHLWVMLFHRRLRFAHRLALLNGIMAYVASPLWFLFLLLVTLEAGRATPAPAIGTEQLSTQSLSLSGSLLVCSTLGLLFFPRLLALADHLLSCRAAQFGGAGRLSLGILCEAVLALFLAPVRMLAHSRFVVEALLNTRLRWAGQNRTNEAGWRDAFRSQLACLALGLAWGGIAWQASPLALLWSLPVVIPLLLSVPITVLTGRAGPGAALRRAGLLITPEEHQAPALVREADAGCLAESPSSGINRIERVLICPHHNRLHQGFARDYRGLARRRELSRLARLCLSEGTGSLTPQQLSALLRDRLSLAWLHQAIWQCSPDSHWGQRLDRFLAGLPHQPPATEPASTLQIRVSRSVQSPLTQAEVAQPEWTDARY